MYGAFAQMMFDLACVLVPAAAFVGLVLIVSAVFSVAEYIIERKRAGQ